jgi:Flp pilus assembly pilin Flp
VNHLPTRTTTDVVAATTSAAEPRPRPHLVAVPSPEITDHDEGEDGSLVAEYGLLAVVAATLCGVLILWARGDALSSFFTALLDHARSIVVG